MYTGKTMKPDEAKQRFLFKLELEDWKPDTPDIFRRISAERYNNETPILYKFTLSNSNKKLKRQPNQTMVAHFVSAKEVVILWDGTPIRIIDGFSDINTAISKFLKSQDDWLKKRFSLGSEHWVWAFTARNLMTAADVLYDTATTAQQKQLKLSLADYSSQQTSGSRECTAEETSLMRYIGVRRQALMLLGFAIENATKGILSYKKRGTKNTAKGALSLADELNCHNLLILVQKCDEVLTEEEADALNKLTEWVIWRGRYPIPTTHFRYDFSYKQHQNSEQTYPLGKVILQRLLNRLSYSKT